jgi:ribosomal protein L11 methyltransferase
MRNWPALDIRDAGDPGLLLAALDDYEPTAIEERGAGVRAFFADSARRDAAQAALATHFPAAPTAAVDVSDEDWARRSQENLKPISVGRLTVFPNLASLTAEPGSIVIQPSMGFGTGHHATTRLCLAGLQAIDVAGARVIDVGTGSGVLAMAARILGAREALGIDDDRDAIQSALENLQLNPGVDAVRFELADVRTATLPKADVVTANLTGTLIIRAAHKLLQLLRPGGTILISGVQSHERGDVFREFAATRMIWESEEDGWLGAAFTLPLATEA